MPRQRKYCICRSTLSNDRMIGCDKCDEWYHFKCIKMKEVPEGDYFCKKCIDKARPQCCNPSCTIEAREKSRYCSDDCGLAYNKKRYLKHFRPKMDRLQKKPSVAYERKTVELENLENKKEDVIRRIGELKSEREELKKRLTDIKEHANQLLGQQANQTKDQDMDDSADEDEEDIITSDQTKTFCVICGVEQQADKAFKHWTSCYKKQESSFVSYLAVPQTPTCRTDPEPAIYCRQFVDKKRNWFCPNLEIVCPQHSNWNPAEGEICGCPLSIVQDLALDGNYCLKLKKDCSTHYHWDRFRLATKDYERALAFQRLQKIEEELFRTQTNYNEHYGGVVGVMLHNTIEHTTEKDEDVVDDDDKMIDV